MRIDSGGPPLRGISESLRARYGASGPPCTDALLRAAGHEVRIKVLRAAQGGLEACVIPLPNGTFRFVCDDQAAPGEPPDLGLLQDPRRFRISFRLAHELAHVAFSCVSFGMVRGPHNASPIEARCDAFAALFLVGASDALAAVDAGEAAVRSLAHQLDVPPRIIREAALAAA